MEPDEDDEDEEELEEAGEPGLLFTGVILPDPLLPGLDGLDVVMKQFLGDCDNDVTPPHVSYHYRLDNINI